MRTSVLMQVSTFMRLISSASRHRLHDIQRKAGGDGSTRRRTFARVSLGNRRRARGVGRGVGCAYKQLQGPLTVALETYRAQARLQRRPTSRRGTDRRGHGDAFVVQKHAARRLHYDLRLEIGDVLASWAVTRGPSLVPGEKRLAVHVEDHPLDYADFEGEIPKGQYGGGEVIVWDRGRWEPEGDPARGLKKGRLDFTLEGAKLKGRWHLVRMGAQPRREARELAADQGQRRRPRAARPIPTSSRRRRPR